MKINGVSPNRGFTQIELMIVVAIVGILATIGVPSFRRMVQKSTQSEAKVNLAALYTAEQAFYSEYGAFGNHITEIGFDMSVASNSTSFDLLEGTAYAATPPKSNYLVGFTPVGCAQIILLQILPSETSSIGKAINSSVPNYYAEDAPSTGEGCVPPAECPPPLPSVITFLGRSSLTVCPRQSPTNGSPLNVYGTNSENFTAAASGVIAPGVDKDHPPDSSYLDIWTLDEQRELTNVQNGVR